VPGCYCHDTTTSEISPGRNDEVGIYGLKREKWESGKGGASMKNDVHHVPVRAPDRAVVPLTRHKLRKAHHFFTAMV
jgi:hypothetical protein